ncbi:dTDP-4-amino-4,6-dideoxygalactose transaminase [Maridesulfovibrio sp.]|uniref:dTDP-4-amino-4,6-dideoxygalactose transaminase n=1 Tax=Maridesulfovibrio sp. TaxID=2795000 RepID=UPI002A186AB0|nr:dTDP-4-amino-4,6-dideoxygalactose transaminase [Maridesulfovibrio sp.]
MRIPFNKPFIVGKELFYIAQAVTKQERLSGDGQFTDLCHKWLNSTLGCPASLLTHSCTAALEMAAILCDLKPGDEVIMPSFTFVSTANAFVLRGAKPVFVDIRSDTLNIDERLIKNAITEKTKAIVVVHYAGAPCEMDLIMRVAQEHNLYVIEDAAQALLSTYNGSSLGTIGDLGTISFHETKNIISGEGGALIINNPKMLERAEIIREKGTDRAKFFRGQIDKYTWVDIGSSFLPSELMAAFLYAQMEEAPKIIKRRCEIFQMYERGLKPLIKEAGIRLPVVTNNSTCNGHLFYILCRDLEQRTAFIDYMKGCGINTVFHYVPLHSSPAGLKYGTVSGEMINTDRVSDQLIRLPLYYEMTDNEVQDVLNEIYNFFELNTDGQQGCAP